MKARNSRLESAKLVAVINKTGNVGKTTIGSCMIAPRLPDLAIVVYVENTNHIPNQLPPPVGKVYGAQEFGDVESELLKAIQTGKSCLIDFGAADFNTIMDMLSQYTEVRDCVDAFIIPCTPSGKELIDSQVTINSLIDLGVPPEKIRVLFNRVMSRDKHNLKRLFFGIFNLQQATLEKHGVTFFASEDATMYQAEIFKRLSDLGKSLEEVLADETDFKKAILAEEDEDKQYELAKRMSIRGLAINTDKTFDKVFDALMVGI